MDGQARNPYNKISTNNGFAIVLKQVAFLPAQYKQLPRLLHKTHWHTTSIIQYLLQFADYVFIAINGDGEETADFLHRKLLVLNKIITFLYGPCTEE